MARKFEYRVAVSPPTGAFAVLADDAVAGNGAAVISGYQPPSFKWSPQNEALYVALAPYCQNNGNGLLNFGFKVFRTFDTRALAAAALITESLIFQVLTNFDFRVTDDGQVFYVINTAPVEFTPDPDPDLSTFIKYGFQGGRYNTTGV